MEEVIKMGDISQTEKLAGMQEVAKKFAEAGEALKVKTPSDFVEAALARHREPPTEEEARRNREHPERAPIRTVREQLDLALDFLRAISPGGVIQLTREQRVGVRQVVKFAENLGALDPEKGKGILDEVGFKPEDLEPTVGEKLKWRVGQVGQVVRGKR